MRRKPQYKGVLLKGGKVIVRTPPLATRKAASAMLRKLWAVTPGAEDGVVIVIGAAT